MNTILPIFIHTKHVPDKCPGCQKDEDTALVCRHCGHEYVEEENPSGWTIFFFIMAIFLIVAFIAMFCNWLIKIDTEPKYDRTFVQFMGDCFRYLWEKVITKLI